jgi:hypothetical protein
MRKWARERATEIGLFLGIWIVYALHVVPGGGVNPNRYFDLTHSLVDLGTITIDAYHENTIDKAYKDGHYYSAGLPGPALAGIPAYLSFKVIYRLLPAKLIQSISSIQSFQQGEKGGFYQRDTTSFFLSTIWITWLVLSAISALGAVFLFHLLIRLAFSSPVALVTTVIYSFGTPVFFYSTTYFSHVFTTSVICVCLYWIVRLCSDPKPLSVAGLGLITGASVLIEFQGFILVALFGFFVLHRWGWRYIGFYVLGASLPIMILLVYLTIAFGEPWHPPQEFLVGENRVKVHSKGILGFTAPTLKSIIGLTFSKRVGLFIFSPVMILVLIGWFMGLRKGRLRIGSFQILCVLAPLVILTYAASYADWRGGAAFGPRQIISVIPFMMPFVALSIQAIPKLIWVPLASLSVLNNWLGAQYGFAKDVFQHWQTFLRQGFVLPAIRAVVDHSTGDNFVLTIVRNWMWAITVSYFLLVVGVVLLFIKIANNDDLNTGSFDRKHEPDQSFI